MPRPKPIQSYQCFRCRILTTDLEDGLCIRCRSAIMSDEKFAEKLVALRDYKQSIRVKEAELTFMREQARLLVKELSVAVFEG